MKFTDDELATVIKAAISMKDQAISEKRARSMQSKVHKQSVEINRLSDEVKRLKQLAHSRGQLLLDIQKRALENQING